jgi:hypothetical protein
VDLSPVPLDLQPVALITYFAGIGLIFFVATHVTRTDLANIPQRGREMARTVQKNVLLVVLAVIAVAAWLAILYVLRSG